MKKINLQVIIFSVVIFAACIANRTKQAKSVETPSAVATKPALKNET